MTRLLRPVARLATLLAAFLGPLAMPALALQSDGGGGGGTSGGGSSGGGGVDVHVDVGGHAGAWYAQPIWIAIFVIGGILVLVLLIMAARGGGAANKTTVVKD